MREDIVSGFHGSLVKTRYEVWIVTTTTTHQASFWGVAGAEVSQAGRVDYQPAGERGKNS